MNTEKRFITLPCHKLAGGVFSESTTSVIREQEIRITLNGRPLATASITLDMEREFITGYLYGQGFLNADGIDRMTLSINGHDATVTLPGAVPQTAHYRLVSGGGRTAATDIDVPPIISDLRLTKEIIFTAMNRLFETAALYRETEAVHAAGLFNAEGEAIITAEDIGRHNCLDKVIGYALVNHVDLSRCLLVSTGRMASEMTVKISRAGIPIATTKTAVTHRGRAAAEAAGLTLIGFVRDTGNRIHTDMDVITVTEPTMKIYTRPDRIIC